MAEEKEVWKAGWNFDNSYARLPKVFYSRQNPTPVRSPELVILNEGLANGLGLIPDALQGNRQAEVFAGNRIPEGAEPLAQAYAGHQFGYFTMLGDGRAVLLGEHTTPKGERYDIQLKGSGITPYSRRGDGRAALGPMLREYIISEAMYALGIPTTRSLAVVKTGEPVYRETELEGAVLTRVAASHLRVGTFQYAAKWGTLEELRTLADYAIARHYPDMDLNGNRYLQLLREVIKRQAELIAKWMLVGFVHGVMNTDNMAISGETIDYGPCAFMDKYDPGTVFSSIDTQGRYAYGNQPEIAGWNLARLAETLLPLLDENEERAIETAENEIMEFYRQYDRHWLHGMRSKIGLFGAENGDEALIQDLLSLMQKHGADFTMTFRALAEGKPEETVFAGSGEFKSWQERWVERRGKQPESEEEAGRLMKHSSPAVIPRNHRVEEALQAAVDEGDYSVMERLLQALADPYGDQPAYSEYREPPAPSSCRYKTFCGT